MQGYIPQKQSSQILDPKLSMPPILWSKAIQTIILRPLQSIFNDQVKALQTKNKYSYSFKKGRKQLLGK